MTMRQKHRHRCAAHFFVVASSLGAFFHAGGPAAISLPGITMHLRRHSFLGVAVAAGTIPVVQPAHAGFFGFGDLPAPPDVAAAPPDAQVTSSGLASKIVQSSPCPPKECERPLAYDRVTVDYTGWQANGKMFDSSITRGQRANFGVSQVIKGWTEGLQLMAVGEKRRFWIPANLAYGNDPGMGRPGGPLVFDVELYSIDRGPKPPPVPTDVAGPPTDATILPSGLAFKVLAPGKPGFESRLPQLDSIVKVEYSGWKTDGELIVSTKVSGQPASFRVEDIAIKGLSEGVRLMTIGESRRFWIPANLAYGLNPDKGVPRGMLVFDVQLLGLQ